MIQASLFRSLILNAFLFISTVSSHHLAGGSIGRLNSITLLFTISIMIFWKKPLKTFEGPALAAILLASQLLGHIFMNSNPSESNFKMFISHILAFGLTYQFANKLDNLAQSWSEIIRHKLTPFQVLVFSTPLKSKRIYKLNYFRNSEFVASNKRERAPPNLFCA